MASEGLAVVLQGTIQASMDRGREQCRFAMYSAYVPTVLHQTSEPDEFSERRAADMEPGSAARGMEAVTCDLELWEWRCWRYWGTSWRERAIKHAAMLGVVTAEHGEVEECVRHVRDDALEKIGEMFKMLREGGMERRWGKGGEGGRCEKGRQRDLGR